MVGVGASVQVSQKQTLGITPKMQMAFKILQMSSLELSAEINEQLCANVLLKLDDGITFERNSSSDEISDENSYLDDIPDKLDFDSGWEEVYNDGTEWQEYQSKQNNDSDGEEESFESFASAEISFGEYLEEQIKQMPLPEDVSEIAQQLVYELDEKGFLQIDLEEIIKRYKVKRFIVEQAISALQNCDPTGVGAANVEECLKLQIAALDRDTPYLPFLQKIMNRHFTELKNPKLVCKALAIDEDMFQAAMNLLRKLKPYPRESYTDSKNTIKITVPDIIVKDKNGIAYIDDREQIRTTPHLQINEDYLRFMNQASRLDKINLKHKLNEAKWLMNCIDRRNDTVRRVAGVIVALQQEFFMEGEKALQPLSRQQVAQMLDVSDTTISRAVRNKYLQCRRGMFEFSYFFSDAIGQTDGEATEQLSHRAIKEEIKAIIKQEDPKKPYSDLQIAELIEKNKNCKIARRTVAKYRQEMNIGGTAERRIK
ncbi:MAG: RNA polymerase factor sigma-54 [Cardiobacteriaceae bacterium]|nr:RNA polymerase factor sigma-54 [Cardiobacteriaceae bacterium]